MADNEIIKALECCVKGLECKNCPANPHKGNYGYCTSLLLKDALDLINRQKAEIERLKDKLDTVKQKVIETIPLVEDDIKTAKAEAYKECIEKVKAEVYNECDELMASIIAKLIDNCLKGVEGE